MGLKELQKKVRAFKRKRERSIIKQIERQKVLIARKVEVEKQRVKLAEQRQILQKLKQKSAKGTFFAGTGKAFKSFRQFATEMTKEPKGKKKKLFGF